MSDYTKNPLLEFGDPDDRRTNKEIVEQLNALGLIPFRDYERIQQWFNDSKPGEPGDPDSFSFSESGNPNNLSAAIIGDTTLTGHLPDMLGRLVQNLFTDPSANPSADPTDHSSYIDKNGNFVGLPDQEYGQVDFGQGLLSESQFEQLNNSELARPMVLPAANSGQASWEDWQQRYNDPEYGGLKAAEQYLNDQERMREISAYQGNGWSPSWISLSSSPQNDPTQGNNPQDGGQGGSQQQPSQGQQDGLTLGVDQGPGLRLPDNPGWGFGSPTYNPQTGRYESTGAAWTGQGGPSQDDIKWLNQNTDMSYVSNQDRLNQQIANGHSYQNFQLPDGSYAPGGTAVNWDQVRQNQFDQALTQKYNSGQLSPEQMMQVNNALGGLLGQEEEEEGLI